MLREWFEKPCSRSLNICDLQPSRARRGHCEKETASLLSHRKGGGTNNFSGLLPNSSTALHLVMTSRTEDERSRWEGPIIQNPNAGAKIRALRIKPIHSLTIHPHDGAKCTSHLKTVFLKQGNLLEDDFFVHKSNKCQNVVIWLARASLQTALAKAHVFHLCSNVSAWILRAGRSGTPLSSV